MEAESDDDLSYVSRKSASKTEDEDEIDLVDVASNDDSSRENLFSFRYGIIWWSVPLHPSKSQFVSDVTVNSVPTVFTKHVSSAEDAYLCFMSEEMLNKILFYSNMEGNRNNASDDKWE
ncbi:unnamed protein product, partial [Rotaria sp. Silwood1]